jgi:hypothetical protein
MAHRMLYKMTEILFMLDAPLPLSISGMRRAQNRQIFFLISFGTIKDKLKPNFEISTNKRRLNMLKTINRFTVVMFVFCICLSMPFAAIAAGAEDLKKGADMMMQGSDMMMKKDMKMMTDGHKIMTDGLTMMKSSGMMDEGSMKMIKGGDMMKSGCDMMMKHDEKMTKEGEKMMMEGKAMVLDGEKMIKK